MNVFRSALVCAAISVPSITLGQTAVAPLPAVVPTMVVGATSPNVLRTGTEVNLKLMEPLSTEGKKLRVGYRFRLEAAEPVMVNGQIVIPTGSPALGEVTEVRNKGMWGKSGHLTASVLYVTVNGRQIRLSGTFDDKGVTGTGAVVGAILFVPVVGFFTTGTSARVPVGAPIKAFVGEDVPLAFSTIGPTPMIVPATSAAIAAPSAK